MTTRRDLAMAAAGALLVGALCALTAPGSPRSPIPPIAVAAANARPALHNGVPPSPPRVPGRDNGDLASTPSEGACHWASTAPTLGTDPGRSAPSSTPTVAAIHVPVLMYHHVMPKVLLKKNERYLDLFVDAATFDAQMAALKAAGWHTITTRRLAAAVMSGTGVPLHSLVITFDDGRPDQFTYAFPILERYGFTATFFVVPGRIGTSQHMTACQLQQVAAAGNELADHTWNHSDLTTLTLEQARSTIRAAADAIESLVRVRPVTMAYPYGRYDSTVEAAADAEGMDLAFTTQHGAFESGATRLAEPRLRVNGLERLPDGRYRDGTTAQSILWLVSAYRDP
jgi:peptidoglycan/xylan/chitin deacetylase (PgdA/CDA1 family)